MAITILIVGSAIEVLVVLFLAGRRSKRRILALELEIEQLKSRVAEMEANPFIQIAKKYRA